jgi:3-methyladenine DNA glycosylase AlkD
MNAKEIQARLRSLGNPEHAATLAWFFKTGPGQYAEGDKFAGLKTPAIRKLGTEFDALPLAQVERLLHSEIHEERSLALMILVAQAKQGNERERKRIYDFYLANTKWVNNWDLVDLSAPQLAGVYLKNRSRKPLYRLAQSKSLWERRISIVSTFHFIRQNDFGDTLAIADLLLDDKEDLIHKATGWMLREVGKRDLAALEGFLRERHRIMPRTMLRYAIEKFEEKKRLAYLKGLRIR